MKLAYSKELQALLQEKSSGKMRYGITVIFLLCMLLIALTPFIKSFETYGAIAEFGYNKKHTTISPLQNNKIPVNKISSTIIPATIQLTAKTIEKIRINQKIVFEKLNAEGYINSLGDTVFKNGGVFINVTIRPANGRARSTIAKAKIKTPVYIIQNETTMFNRLSTYVMRSIKK